MIPRSLLGVHVSSYFKIFSGPMTASPVGTFAFCVRSTGGAARQLSPSKGYYALCSPYIYPVLVVVVVVVVLVVVVVVVVVVLRMYVQNTENTVYRNEQVS